MVSSFHDSTIIRPDWEFVGIYDTQKTSSVQVRLGVNLPRNRRAAHPRPSVRFACLSLKGRTCQSRSLRPAFRDGEHFLNKPGRHFQLISKVWYVRSSGYSCTDRLSVWLNKNASILMYTTALTLGFWLAGIVASSHGFQRSSVLRLQVILGCSGTHSHLKKWVGLRWCRTGGVAV